MLRRLLPFAADLWMHRELLWQFTLRNVELRHKGSHLGLIWSFLSPLLMLALYVLVFGYIFGGSFGVIRGETRVDYALGIFIGLTIFHLLAETLALAPSLIVGNPNFVKKVVFPLEILPAANVGAAYEKSFLAFQLGNPKFAAEWDKLASDIVHLGRTMARDGMSGKVALKYRKCMEQWGELNEHGHVRMGYK